MNPLSAHLRTGTAGELLLQLRLLQYNVQAAPPLKDTGNDLIAIKGDVFKAIQVKTATEDRPPRWENPDRRRFHLLGLVRLQGEGDELTLDECDIYLVPVANIPAVRAGGREALAPYELNATLVERLFAEPGPALET